MKKSRVLLFFVAILGSILGFALLVEKSSRFTYDAKVFTQKHVTVHYEWKTAPPSIATNDPVNVGVARKWLGGKRYDWEIDIPSFAAANHFGVINRDSIVAVAPVVGYTYECADSFWTITCKGDFTYKINPEQTVFMKEGNYFVNPPEKWLTDTRHAKLTVYKYF
jgi:hypothetical protein